MMRNELRDAEMTPPAGGWEQLRQELAQAPENAAVPAEAPDRGRVMRLRRLRIVAAAAAVLVCVVTGELLWRANVEMSDDGIVVASAVGSGDDAAEILRKMQPDGLREAGETSERAEGIAGKPVAVAENAVQPSIASGQDAAGMNAGNLAASQNGLAAEGRVASENPGNILRAGNALPEPAVRTGNPVPAEDATPTGNPVPAETSASAGNAALAENSVMAEAVDAAETSAPAEDAALAENRAPAEDAVQAVSAAERNPSAAAVSPQVASSRSGVSQTPSAQSPAASRQTRRTAFDETFVAYVPPRGKTSFGVFGGGGVSGSGAPGGAGGNRVSSSDFSTEVGTGNDLMLMQRTEYDRGEFRHHQPVSFGLSVRKEFAHGLSLESGVNYTLLRSDVRLRFATKDVSQRLHFIGVPLRMNWQYLRRGGFSLYIGAGGMVEKCVSAKFGSEVVDEKGVQWSVQGAAGAEYRFGGLVGLYFEPEVSYYFTETSLQTARTDSPLSLTLRLGVRFSF